MKYINDRKAFNEYSNDMNDIYENVEEHNPNEKHNILIDFDDIIDDILSNKKLNRIVTELFIKAIKPNISFAFITQCHVAVPKNIRIYSTNHFIMKIPNK